MKQIQRATIDFIQSGKLIDLEDTNDIINTDPIYIIKHLWDIILMEEKDQEITKQEKELNMKYNLDEQVQQFFFLNASGKEQPWPIRCWPRNTKNDPASCLYIWRTLWTT